MAAIEESLSDLVQGYLSIWAQDTPLIGYLLNSPLLFSTSRATCHLLSAPGMIDLKLPRDYLGIELRGLLLIYLSIFPYTKYTTATLVIIKTMNGNGK